MIRLDSLEREWRRDVRERAREVCVPPSLLASGLVAMLVTPSILCVGVFVPFVGQLLLVGNVVLALGYIVVKRSILLSLSILSGVVAAFCIMALVAQTFAREAAAFYYLVMAFSMFISIGTFIVLVGRIWVHYEAGRLARTVEA